MCNVLQPTLGRGAGCLAVLSIIYMFVADLVNFARRDVADDQAYASAEAALDGILRNGMLLAVGGFGTCGVPVALIEALRAKGARNLIVVSNNAGLDGWAWGSTAAGAHQEDDFKLCGGKCRVRSAISCRRGRS